MSTVLFWFRNDLRLHDQPALQAALDAPASALLPVVCLPPAQSPTAWGFARIASHRRAFYAAGVSALGEALARRGQRLLVCQAEPSRALPALARAVGAVKLVCEDIAAPEERNALAALRVAGLTVQAVWQSSLFDPTQLPWPVTDLPGVFTAFRQALERACCAPAAPLPAAPHLPSAPHIPAALERELGMVPAAALGALHAPAMGGGDARSSFPYATPGCNGAESAALAHLAQYLERGLPHTYKATRNALTGRDFSSKLSPWLASGALSPRQVWAALQAFEHAHGANEGSYWLGFELLWRDYFRFLHLRHGAALYRARGLGDAPLAAHNAQGFAQWCEGRTGEPLVDAAMRELAATGYLSNRLRQVAASYLVHALGGDWRAGAAWFESQLVDYDVYSNQGNWLYIAGRGTDPRGGRRFNAQKQAQEHDPDGLYRRLWGTA